MKHFHQAFLIALFFLALLAPAVSGMFHVVQFKRADENRRFHDSLSISLAQLDKFPKGCEAYVDDNFPFRTPLIASYKRLKFDLYHVSPNPNLLIVGKHGRYFIADEEKKAFEGDIQFTPQELRVFEREWIKRKHYFDSLGIPVYLMLCPTALEIYPEELPNNIRKRYAFNRFNQLEQRFSKHLSGLIVNPTSVLLEGKKHANMYFMLDNHWTEKGGFLASKLLLERMKKEQFPDLDLRFLQDYTWRLERRDYGYFVDLIGVPGQVEWIPVHGGHIDEAEQAPNYKLDFTHEGISMNEQQYRFIHKNPKNKLKILVIRDSFGQAVYPFVKEAFAETLFIFDAWNYRMNKSIIAAYHPDVVVFMTYDPSLKNHIDPENWE